MIRGAILILCFQAATAIADSYIPAWKNFATPICRTSMTQSCDLKWDLNLRAVPHWNSSLRLNIGGEDIQIQIKREVWSKIRHETVRGVLLPAAGLGIQLPGSQAQSSPDQLEYFVKKLVKKLLLADHPWRNKPRTRCRNNPGAIGCD